MASSYTVPEKEEWENESNEGTVEKEEKSGNELQSIDDLPKFLRRAIFNTPRKYKKIYMLLNILSQCGTSMIGMTYITSSGVIGTMFGIYFAIGGAALVLQPDFTKGVFLDILLKDEKLTKKINENIFNDFVVNIVIALTIMAPLMWMFFIIPVANTDLFGPSTYTVTMACGIVGWIATILLQPLCATWILANQVSLAHIAKIKKYLQTVRDIILSSNSEDGIPLAKKLSKEQNKVEKWIIAVNNGMSSSNTLMICNLTGNLIIFLIMLGSGQEIGATIFFAVFSILMWMFLSSTLYAIAKPNMIWEQQKILLLNDAEVISAVILKLKFPKENFESWLQLHNVNASRVFGTKVTFEKMKQAAGVITSGFGIILYLLLREELRGMI
jgi:hypothetical protein